jgi:hypothetical protein
MIGSDAPLVATAVFGGANQVVYTASFKNYCLITGLNYDNM